MPGGLLKATRDGREKVVAPSRTTQVVVAFHHEGPGLRPEKPLRRFSAATSGRKKTPRWRRLLRHVQFQNGPAILLPCFCEFLEKRKGLETWKDMESASFIHSSCCW